MPSLHEIEKQSQVLIQLLTPYVQKLELVHQENERLRKQIAGLQNIDIDAIAVKAAALVVVKDGVDGLPGADGKSVSIDDLNPVIEDIVNAKFAQIDPPKNGEKGDRGDDGAPGADGKSVEIDDIMPKLIAHADEYLALIPIPKDGAPGIDGKSVSIDDVLPTLKEFASHELVQLVAQIPTPQDGKSVSVDEVADAVLPQLKSHAEDVISKISIPEPKSVSAEEVAALLEKPVVDTLADAVEKHVSIIKEAAETAISEIEVPHGKDGTNGVDGTSVSIDDIMSHVEKMAKDLFDSLPKPKDGAQGEPGKDAVDIHILPEIDFAKSYPRGTWAHHNGGLYKSHAKTLGERGWDCVINGIAGIDVEKSGDREILVKITDSRGQETVKTFSMRNAIYREIYDEKKDAEYEPDDMVTCGGSVWHCLTKNPGRPGTANRNWQLAVKHGAHGKDGRNGIDFTKPVVIGDQS